MNLLKLKLLVRSGLLLLLLPLLLLGTVGCFFGGGAEASDDEMGLMSFEDFPDEPTPVSVEEAVKGIAFDGVVLEEISYLYSVQVSLEELQRLNRDLIDLQSLKAVNGEKVGLEWVIDVHDVAYEASLVFDLVLTDDVPEIQRERHSELYVSRLEIVQVMSFGAARLQRAASIIGPNGRNLEGLTLPEANEFHTTIREAGFFLRDGNTLVKELSAEVGAKIKTVSLH